MLISSEVRSASLPAFGSARSLGRQKPRPSPPSFLHTVIEWLRLEGTSGGHLVQPPLLKQGHLEWAAQGCVQLGFPLSPRMETPELPQEPVLASSPPSPAPVHSLLQSAGVSELQAMLPGPPARLLGTLCRENPGEIQGKYVANK